MNKNKKYRVNAKIVTIGVLAAVILVNLFVTLLVKKLPIKFDMTSEKIYELSKETKQMLAEYDTPVDIYFIAGSSYETSDKLLGNIAQVLENYQKACKNITYTSIDAAKNPTFGTKYADAGETIGVGSVILDAGSRYKVYYYSDFYNTSTSQQTGKTTATSLRAEQMVNAGLKYITSDEEFTAYILKGHNEKALSGLEGKLKDENYTVNELNLATEDIPEGAKLLVIAAPEIDYTSAELAKLDAFFQNAGKAMIMFDYASSGLSNLYGYLADWGIAVNDDVAVEQDQAHSVKQIGIVLADYADSDIVAQLKENKRYIGYFPYSKSIGLLFSSNNGITTETVLKTTENSYSTTDFSELKNLSGSTGSQIISATAVKQFEDNSDKAMIFVSGTTTLMDASEQTVSGFGLANYDYIKNVLNFMHGTYEDSSISAKYLHSGRLMMNEVQALVFGGIFAVLIPLIFLIYGIVVWVKRRNL